MPVRLEQPGPGRVPVHLHVDVAVLSVVGVAPVVDDRGGGEAAAAVQNPAGLERHARGVLVRHMPVRHMVGVGVQPANPLVEVQELLGRDLTRVQRREPVLDADVVERSPGEPGLGVDAVDIHRVVVDGRADPVGVPGRVISLRLERRHAHLAPLLLGCGCPVEDRVDARRATAQVRNTAPRTEPGDRPLLHPREQTGCRGREVVVQEPRVGQREDGRRGHVREAGTDDDAVEHAGIVVGRLVALIRAARPTGADGEDRRPVALDEPLLHHHVGLGRQQVVAILPEDVERCRRHRIPAVEQPVAQHAAGAASLLIPAAAAAATVGVDQLAVPPGAAGPRVRCRLGRVVQHSALVDGAVHRPGLHPHDERHGVPVGCRRRVEVGRPGAIR